MNQSGDDFFARAAFAQHQDGNINVGDGFYLRADLPHRRTGSEEEEIIAELLDLVGEGSALRSETAGE